MNKKYQFEIDSFIQRFGGYQDSRIVLYGIGRYTATLLEGLEGFHIVGLMDKDPANIGKEMFGIPIIDKASAEKIADMVIINTAETYWNVIYGRIQDIKIPVYYINGKKAEKRKHCQQKNPFRKLSCVKMNEKIEWADIVSFDFFDTLFTRSVCNPQDIFRLIELQSGISFTQLRDEAKKDIRGNYSLDELYSQMEILGNIPHRMAEKIKNIEIEIEKKLLIPRRQILSCMKALLEQGKEVYIISDMYLPKSFYSDVLTEYGISIADEFILLSNDLDQNKLDGTLWKYYLENIIKGRSALHIGDNTKADISEPEKYGLKTYQTPNAWDIALNSSLKDIIPYIYNTYDTAIMGCILSRIFENPFVFHNTDGAVCINNNKDMGYCVFGPVILTFLLWLREQSQTDGIKKLIFMSRDGFFLKDDFESLCRLTGEQKECCYIGISRQLAMKAAIETEKDLLEYISMPYTGNMAEMFKDKFDIENVNIKPGKQPGDYIDDHLPEIEKNIADVRRNYLAYLKKTGVNNDCAIVDIGYYGNNQKYLNQLLGTEIPGYYFNANLSDKNKNAKEQRMTACFQKDVDVTGENSCVLKKQIYIESFLTAPYGMVKAIAENGNFICAPNKKNQEYFKEKEEINEGVKQFIADYIDRFEKFGLRPDIEFIDKYYGSCFGGTMEFSDEVKKSFYNDNAMMNRIESSLFY